MAPSRLSIASEPRGRPRRPRGANNRLDDPNLAERPAAGHRVGACRGHDALSGELGPRLGLLRGQRSAGPSASSPQTTREDAIPHRVLPTILPIIGSSVGFGHRRTAG